MTLQQIQDAVRAGKTVFCHTTAYVVELHHFRSGAEQWLVRCAVNGSYVGLTHADGVTLTEDESSFFVGA